MKKLFTLGALLFAGTAFAQTENVGIGTAQPDKSAILDLSSSNKGFLLPRMSETQRLNIVKPAQGLQVYQTDGTAGLYVYNGKDWENASKSVTAATDPWLGGGNAIDNSDFLGSTNDKPLVFKAGTAGKRVAYFDYLTNGGIYIGLEAGRDLLTAAPNPNNTFNIDNVAIGYQALTGNGSSSPSISSNVAIGTRSLNKNQSGGSVGIGAYSLENNIGGYQNVGIGAEALKANVSGNRNMALGMWALKDNLGSGNVGIGFAAGAFAVAGSNNIFIGNEAGLSEAGSSKLYIATSNTPTPLIGGDFANNYLKFHTGTSAPTATAGFVAIGDFSAAGSTGTPGTGAINSFPGFTAGSKYRLVVQDGILTEKLKVALRNGTDWADYVFEPDYKLMPLENVESFIKTNKHLPNVPSADEMAKNGLDVLQTSAKLMEKIEELTLYLIDLKKEVENIKQENQILREKLK